MGVLADNSEHMRHTEAAARSHLPILAVHNPAAVVADPAAGLKNHTKWVQTAAVVGAVVVAAGAAVVLGRKSESAPVLG